MHKKKVVRRKRKEVWIGTAHVKQPDGKGVLGKIDEAIVNVLAVAADRSDFRRQVKKEVEALGTNLIRLKDVNSLKLRLTKHSIHEDVAKLAEEVKLTGQVAFDVFYTFKTDTSSSGR
ncbi:MAG TPA: hypothetical protein VJV03_17580 [Pyrinomonadaceae bacterium]|nr:hypothetical protein [Pyrinomonadaceae bacterium]